MAWDYYAGIDIGSRMTKVIIMNDDTVTPEEPQIIAALGAALIARSDTDR